MQPEMPKYPVIDMHAHLGNHEIRRMSLNCIKQFIEESQRANITASVVSQIDALYSHQHKAQLKHNRQLLKIAEKHKEIFLWWVVDPRHKASIKAAKEIASHPLIVGYKIHPHLHGYSFSQLSDPIVGLACETDLPILSHAGNKGCMPGQIVNALKCHPDIRFIIAHFGNCDNYKGHLNALKDCTSDNVFTDTSSAVSIECGIIEEAVNNLGIGRFVFGSDHLCYHASSQFYRIFHGNFFDERVQRRILWENAAKHLLKPSQVEQVEKIFKKICS